jgi:hypothetical protein
MKILKKVGLNRHCLHRNFNFLFRIRFRLTGIVNHNVADFPSCSLAQQLSISSDNQFWKSVLNINFREPQLIEAGSTAACHNPDHDVVIIGKN